VTDLAPGIVKCRNAHVWERAADDFYPTRPRWVIDRLLDAEIFIGEVIDPCCGSGTIVVACRERHLPSEGWDIRDRGLAGTQVRNFLEYAGPRPCNFIFNVPFCLAQQFAEHAVELARHKTAMLFPVRSLNAAGWLRRLPASRIWLITPRPSMPPQSHIERGGKVGGGSIDFCWIIFEPKHVGAPRLRWLHRDEGKGNGND
jgi:hypothetical protein